MAEYVYEREIELASPREEVFDFFSKAENLERITPPSVGFNMISKPPIEMGVGTLIDYTISLRGIPVKWRTEITVWDPPNEFEDIEVWGPYKQWIHRHTFEDTDRGTTLMRDNVRYRLPLEPLGDIAQWLVARELESIFDYRQKVVGEIFK